MGKLKCQIAGSECCKTCKHDADEPMGDVCKECMSCLCTLIYEEGTCEGCNWERDLEKFPINIEKIHENIDILDRLRICNEVEIFTECKGVIKDAIYEIERLRTENENLYSENWSLQVDLDYMKDEGKQI